jgi:hypothetical protein
MVHPCAPTIRLGEESRLDDDAKGENKKYKKNDNIRGTRTDSRYIRHYNPSQTIRKPSLDSTQVEYSIHIIQLTN